MLFGMKQRLWLHTIAFAVVVVSIHEARASGFVKQKAPPSSHIAQPKITSPKLRPTVVVAEPQQQRSWQVLGIAALDDSGLQLLHPTQQQVVVTKSPLKRGLDKTVKAIRNHTFRKIVLATNGITSTALLCTAFITRFSTVPTFLGPIHHVWLGTTILSTSLSLAEAATKNQPAAVRNWIMSFQVMALCLSCLADWAGPFSLGFLKNPVISRAIFCRLSGIVSLFNIKNIQSGSKLIEHRRDKSYNVPRIIDAMTYVMPNAIGLVWSGYLAWFVGLRHSKHSYMTFLANGGASNGSALAYYTCFISTLSALATPWIAHLRERKVFTKRSEVGSNLGLAAICFWMNGLAISAGLLPFPKFIKA